VELEASASYDTLAATTSFGQISFIILSYLAIISLVSSLASFVRRLISLIRVIGLGLICLNSRFSILGRINCIGPVCSIGTNGISRLVGCIGHISLVGLGGFGSVIGFGLIASSASAALLAHRPHWPLVELAILLQPLSPQQQHHYRFRSSLQQTDLPSS
jgi:hypothetical protein